MVAGTGALSTNATYQVVPGLEQAVLVAEDTRLIVETDGGFVSASDKQDEGALIEVALFVDGAPAAMAGARRLSCPNNKKIRPCNAAWSFGLVADLAPGIHEISVRARQVVPGSYGAEISGGPGDIHQGQLTVVIVER